MNSEILAQRASEFRLETTMPMKLAHIVLKTSRFDEMVNWYKIVLQVRTAFQTPGPGLSFMTFDDEHHRIAIAQYPNLEEQDQKASGVEHIAFTYRSLGQLLGNYQRLKDRNILPVWAINHGPTMSFYYRDPDNNQLELQVDNFCSLQETDEFLLTDFAPNPIGVEFDPDDLINRYLAGESFNELTKRPDIGVRTLADPIPMPPPKNVTRS